METTLQKRIEQAWKVSQGWIMEFTGAPTVALLVNVAPEAIVPGLTAIAAEADNLRITLIPADKPAEPQFIPLDAVSAQIPLLLEGKNAELSANWVTHRPAFDLDLRLVMHPLENGLVSLEVDWWSDQVFSIEEDNPAQFLALMHYFIELQRAFAAPGLFLIAESGLDPNAPDNSWVEV